jgi:hypothetical protein
VPVDRRPVRERTNVNCASPNRLTLGDVVWCSLYGWGRLYYPGTGFLVRVAGFTRSFADEESVKVEAVERSDFADNEWTVPFSFLRREAPDA